MAETTTTHALECPDCGEKFTVTKTPEQFEDEDDETPCPKCGGVFLSAIDEDTEDLYLLAGEDEEDDDSDDSDEEEDEEDEDEDEE